MGKTINFYKHLKALALTAFCCTVLLTIFLWIESVMPSDLSAAQSVALSDSIVDTFQISDSVYVIPDSLAIADSENSYYIGDTVNLDIVYSPENTSWTSLTCASSNVNVATVSEEGTVTFYNKGSVTITVTSTANTDATASIELNCAGINPENISDFEIILSDSIAVGEAIDLIIESDEVQQPLSGFAVSINNGNLAFFDNRIYALYEGTATVTAEFGDTIREKTLIINPNPQFVEPVTITSDTSITLTVGDTYIINHSITPAESPSDVYYESDNDSIKIFNGSVYAYSEGDSTITIRSVYNADCVVSIPVHVNSVLPEGMQIVGNDRAVINKATKYSVSFDNNPRERDIVWSVSGAKNYIDDDGYLFAKRFGKITIRATSAISPEIYAEKTVTVTLYQSFYMFVRKIIGHFSLFALLGFGIAFTLILLLKNNLIAIFSTPIIGFVCAGISEMLQLPYFTTGRYASWTDVLIDIFGVIFGLLVAVMIISVTIIIWKKVNSRSYNKLIDAYKNLTFKSVFKKD